MITLHQPPGAWGLPSLSPFCVKLEAYFKLAGVPYQVKGANPQRSPKGKVPYVRFEDGTVMGDSQLVVEACKARFGDPLDGGLSAAARATGHLVRRTLEEGTYFALVWDRWTTERNWPAQVEAFRPLFPNAFVAAFAMPMIRNKVRSSLQAQGTGRHAEAEIVAMASADFEAVSTILGGGPWLLGERPTSFDATVFGMCSAIHRHPVDGPMQAALRAHPNLVAYVDRVQAELFGTEARAAAG